MTPPPPKKKKKKIIHKIFMPKKYSFFWKPEKQLKFKILNPNNYPRLRIYENITVPNIIISSIFDEVEHAIKKKSCGKITTVTGPTG